MTGSEALKALEDNKTVRRKSWPKHYSIHRRIGVHLSRGWLEEIASNKSFTPYEFKEMAENIIDEFLFNDDWEVVS